MRLIDRLAKLARLLKAAGVHDVPRVGPGSSEVVISANVASLVSVSDRLGPDRPVVVCHRIGDPEPEGFNHLYQLGDCELCGSSVWVNPVLVESFGPWPVAVVCYPCVGAERRRT